MNKFYIGWDVGGWNCDKNGKSRDAIVILDSDRKTVGEPWRGNLRVTINEAKSTLEWLEKVFALCRVELPIGNCNYVLGIDTPLGFSDSFNDLVSNLVAAPEIENSATNPYLFRETERFLFCHGITPLSAVKDMIGSQATKGIHALAKFAPQVLGCGVWGDGDLLQALEAYPSPCKKSNTIQSLRAEHSPLGHDDKEDALTCALIAYLHSEHQEYLEPPFDEVANREGWIWVPKDVLG